MCVIGVMLHASYSRSRVSVADGDGQWQGHHQATINLLE